jgi:hypothetical protein
MFSAPALSLLSSQNCCHAAAHSEAASGRSKSYSGRHQQQQVSQSEGLSAGNSNRKDGGERGEEREGEAKQREKERKRERDVSCAKEKRRLKIVPTASSSSREGRKKGRAPKQTTMISWEPPPLHAAWQPVGRARAINKGDIGRVTVCNE